LALKVKAILINVCARLALLVVLLLLFLAEVIGTNDEVVNGAVSLGTDYGSVDGTACGTVSQWIGTETLSIAYTSTISN